jgi:hypothetical protein
LFAPTAGGIPKVCRLDAQRFGVACGREGVAIVRVRTGLPVSARLALVALGVLVILVGLFARGIILEGAGYAGDRVANPDGTVSYWDPEGATDENYAVRAEDGSEYSGNGPAFVWIIGGATSILVGLWPGRRSQHDTPTPEPTRA